MNEWEEMGLTREEYEQAMSEMDEALGLSEPPSDAEMCAMHIEHLKDEARKGRMKSVQDYADAYGAIGELSVVADDPGLYPAVQRDFNDMCDALGYSSESALPFDDVPYDNRRDFLWAKGQEAAKQQGMDWYAALYMQHADECPDAPVSKDDLLHNMSFGFMPVAVFMRGDEWTDEMNRLMNDKIIDRMEELDNARYETDASAFADTTRASGWDDLREQEGLKGDEEDIPWYKANELGFGQDADEYIEARNEQLADDMSELDAEAEKIYKAAYRVQTLPYVGNGKRPTLSKQALAALGSDYEKFVKDHEAELQARATHQREVFDSVDLGAKPKDASEYGAEPEAQDEKMTEPVKNGDQTIYNSVEHGRSTPDFDFDEVDYDEDDKNPDDYGG